MGTTQRYKAKQHIFPPRWHRSAPFMLRPTALRKAYVASLATSLPLHAVHPLLKVSSAAPKSIISVVFPLVTCRRKWFRRWTSMHIDPPRLFRSIGASWVRFLWRVSFQWFASFGRFHLDACRPCRRFHLHAWLPSGHLGSAHCLLHRLFFKAVACHWYEASISKLLP